MASKFRICIIREDEKPVYLLPGSQGERDLVEAVTAQTIAQGVGIFRTEAHVRDALITGFATVLNKLKSEVVPG